VEFTRGREGGRERKGGVYLSRSCLGLGTVAAPRVSVLGRRRLRLVSVIRRVQFTGGT
jgi:hypothetical protein